jgi:biopolymer transport protein ExbB
MLEILLQGGYIMIPLLALSVLALAVIVDRVRAFRVAERGDPEGLFSGIRDKLTEDDLPGAIDLCKDEQGPFASVLLTGLYKYRMLRDQKRSRQETTEYLDKTLGEYTPHVIEGLQNRLNLLLMISSVSPLLGMTGTVTGMISSFNQMRMSGVGGEAVSGGISEALITTAGGLLIALPAMVSYFVFSRKADALTLRLEEKANDFVEHVNFSSAGKR